MVPLSLYRFTVLSFLLFVPGLLSIPLFSFLSLPPLSQGNLRLCSSSCPVDNQRFFIQQKVTFQHLNQLKIDTVDKLLKHNKLLFIKITTFTPRYWSKACFLLQQLMDNQKRWLTTRNYNLVVRGTTFFHFLSSDNGFKSFDSLIVCVQ